jgi:hypothetical protein
MPGPQRCAVDNKAASPGKQRPRRPQGASAFCRVQPPSLAPPPSVVFYERGASRRGPSVKRRCPTPCSPRRDCSAPGAAENPWPPSIPAGLRRHSYLEEPSGLVGTMNRYRRFYTSDTDVLDEPARVPYSADMASIGSEPETCYGSGRRGATMRAHSCIRDCESRPALMGVEALNHINDLMRLNNGVACSTAFRLSADTAARRQRSAGR